MRCWYGKLLVHGFSSFNVTNTGAGLLCPSCLGVAINDRIDLLVEEKGMEGFQKFVEPYRSQTKLIKNVDYTVDDGLYVFSKWYLVKQGECCNNGCKNCPY